jgi:hypothetical protein
LTNAGDAISPAPLVGNVMVVVHPELIVLEDVLELLVLEVELVPVPDVVVEVLVEVV